MTEEATVEEQGRKKGGKTNLETCTLNNDDVQVSLVYTTVRLE
jgi:hypothetical protein